MQIKQVKLKFVGFLRFVKQLNNDLIFQLAEITDLAYADTGDMALDADTYGKALEAITTDTCT